MRATIATWWWRRRVWAVPVAVFVALSLSSLFGGRWAVDMGWYGGISRSIVERGDPWFLFAGDQPYFNKPPLAFWLTAACQWVFGGGTWVVRFSGWLCACGCVAATTALVRRLDGPRAGFAAGMVMAATPELLRASTDFRLDVPHLLFMLLTMLGVVTAAKRELAGGRGFALAGPMLLSGVATGLALMTKPFFGPLAYVFMAPWLLWMGAYRTVLWIAASLVVSLAVASPWHVSMAMHYGQPFVDVYLGRETIGRALGTAFESDPWWYYLKLMVSTYWPWLVVLAAAGVHVAKGRRLARNRKGLALAVLWSVLWIVAVSVFPDKRRQYILPVYPGLAWIAGLWLANVLLPRAKGLRVRLNWVVSAGVVASALIAATGTSYFWRSPLQRHWVDLFSFLQQRASTDGPVELWSGAVYYNNAAMIGAVTGRWPRTIDWRPDYRTPPPVGALVLYSEGPPPPGVEEVFRSGSVIVVKWPPGMKDPRDHDRPPSVSR